MRLVAAGPALVALGALAGSGRLRALGTVISLGSAAAFANIAASPVVPGANDNLTAVAVVLELARLLRERPVRGVRVLLLSTGSEESSMEGMRGFVRRHRDELPRERTRMVCIESVGSDELIIIEGEGMIRMTDYPEAMRDLLGDAAARAGLPIRRGLRLGLATDALIALRAGYRTATIASVNPYKFPANYHKPTDVAANVVWETVRRATAVCEEVVRGVAERGGAD
jgi:Zn-dependent M28 family amino/carboxypeptidase